MWHRLQTYLVGRTTMMELLAWHIVQIVIWFVAAKLAIRLATRLIHRLFSTNTTWLRDRRRQTLETLLDNIVRYVTYFLFGIISLQTLGAHVEALLAGAGIAGIAVGFGAQSLIRDVLTGTFILFEDQYAVGDVVQINGFTGTVESIGLRLTKLKAWTGEVALVPNGQVQQVTNYSKHNSIAIVDVPVIYGTDIDMALNIMTGVMMQLKRENEDIVGDIQPVGIQSVSNGNLVLRVTAECRPLSHYNVQREAYRRIHDAFTDAGIGIAGVSIAQRVHPAKAEGEQ